VDAGEVETDALRILEFGLGMSDVIIDGLVKIQNVMISAHQVVDSIGRNTDLGL
jgi:hypothetical protein